MKSNVIAIGFFDGVHLGHRKILCGASTALTFRNHPLAVLAPERAPHLIMSCDDRVAAIRACGVGEVIVLDFTSELASLFPEDFIARYLGRYDSIRCGANWHFGKGGLGDATLARKLGIGVEVVPYAEHKGERISSSRIRTCLQRGEIEDANAMMGRRFEVKGKREKGKGLGTRLGYPTINLRLSTSTSNLHLPQGVYEVVMNGVKGVANYGVAPTMGDQAWSEPVLEVHLLNPQSSTFSPQPSTSIRVEIVRFLRSERKFASVDDLKSQIAADCAMVNRQLTVTDGARLTLSHAGNSVLRIAGKDPFRRNP